MNKKDAKDEMERANFEYVGNEIPLFIKIIWAILIIWIIGYLFYFALPDLKMWISK